MTDADAFKREAARKALEFVTPGMTLGLGTGTTAKHFVDLLGERVRDGLEVVCVPTSERTRAQAESASIPLTTLDDAPDLDLTVDGADEIDLSLRLIKGGGGALLREKIVASASRRMIVIATADKLVDRLGRFSLPVEVVPFGMEATRRHIIRAASAFGCYGPVQLRRAPDGHAFVTDGGHVIFDCAFGAIEDPDGLAPALSAIAGVVEHGLFIGLARTAILADINGVRTLGDAGL